MKYVMFKRNNLMMPMIIPNHVTHSQVKIIGAEVVSAGFFKLEKGKIITYG